LLEEEEQITGGSAAVTALLKEHGLSAQAPEIVSWREHLQSYLAAAGGVNGGSPRRPKETLPPSRRSGEYIPARVPRRDRRFPHVWQSRGVVPDPSRPVHERIWWMMNVRLNEMHVSELSATVITDC